MEKQKVSLATCSHYAANKHLDAAAAAVVILKTAFFVAKP